MKKTVNWLALTLLGVAAGAQAGHDDWRRDADRYRDSDRYYDYAKVVSVKPLYKIVRVDHPRRECWNEQQVHYHQRDSAGPAIVGGLVGGALGNRVGKGRGRDVATVAGVLLGASIARDLDRYHNPGEEHLHNERVCRTVNEYSEEERIEGYRVKYRYRGRTYVTRTDHDPGKRIRVRVAVDPVD